MTTQETLIHSTAQALGFSYSQVEKVARSLSSYVANLMEEGQYQAFRWPHVGVWRVKPMRAQRLGLEVPPIKPTKFMAAKLQDSEYIGHLPLEVRKQVVAQEITKEFGNEPTSCGELTYPTNDLP